jgi:hypothetical protein
MAVAEPKVRASTEPELAETVEDYKRDHPELAEAMKVFQISNDAYQAAVDALYGPRVSWASSANQATQDGTSKS